MSTNDKHAEGVTRPGIRWWPAWVILTLAAVVLAGIRFLGDVPFQTRNLRSLAVILVALGLMSLWWLLLSRAPWRARLAGVLAAGVLGGLPAALFRIRGVSGDLVPILEPRWSRAGMAAQDAGGPPASAASVPAKPATTTATNADRLAAWDFPQFQGPTRDGILSGPELSRDWMGSPPKVVWKQAIGAAWSGFAIVGTRAVTQEQRGPDELVSCYEVTTGRSLWTHADVSRYATTIAGEGPRATPTIVGGKVFTLGANGILNCLDLATGERVWTRDIGKDAGASVPGWGYAGSPLVIDGRVIVSAGGHPDRSLLAYRAGDGTVEWMGGDRPVNYSSPALLELLGARQVIMFNGKMVTAHVPETGAVLWEYPWGIGQPHVAMPVPAGTNRLVLSSGYGVGAELIELDRGANGVITPRQVWKSIRLKSKFANFFHRDGYIYGLDDGILACVDAKDGSLKWKEGRYGHGQMLWVKGLLLIMAESGELVLLEPNPEKPGELARFRVFDAKTWNPPALSGDWLLVRNDIEAACVRLPITSQPVDTGRGAH